MEQSYPGVKLHLGSGSLYWEGWVNVDLHGIRADVKCDLRALHFKDDFADVAVAVHVLEHFYSWEAQAVLTEWSRVLRPGGTLILELPCMDKVLSYIMQCMQQQVPVNPAFSWWAFWGDPRHQSVPMCHKWGYTEYMMQELLAKVGFVDIQTETPRYHFKERDMRFTAKKGA